MYRQNLDDPISLDDDVSNSEEASRHHLISEDEIEDVAMPLFEPLPQAAPPRGRKGFLVRMLAKISRPQWMQRSVTAKAHSYLQRAEAETERAAKLSAEVCKVACVIETTSP